jgi:hypothetical protein
MFCVSPGRAQHLQAGILLEVFSLIRDQPSWADPSANLANLMTSESFYSAFEAFCTDEYWRPIWIIQEFAVGNDIQLLVQGELIGQDQLWRLLSLLGRDFCSANFERMVRRIASIRKSY